jgi:hypothetical protein
VPGACPKTSNFGGKNKKSALEPPALPAKKKRSRKLAAPAAPKKIG